jgi:peptide/nickel transport system substrate-binding protein
MSNRWQSSNAAPDRRPRGAAHGTAIALLLCALGGCAPAPDAVLRFALPAAPGTLDPRFATDAQAARLCRLLYARLVDFDDSFRPVAGIATWTTDDATHYRFALRGNPSFHDGSALTAADVVATYRAVLDPSRASPHRGSLVHVREVSARDPRTVEFTLARADPLFPGLLTIGILRDADARRPVLPARPIGSGHFRLADTPTPARVPLARVRDGLRLDFVEIANETTRALMLARGELDLAQGSFAPELADWLARRPGLRVHTRPGTVFSYLGLNLAHGATASPDVRRALAHAIDRDALLRHVFRGRARAAEGMLVPEHWAGYPGLQPWRHDPARARALLARAGYAPPRRLRLVYSSSSDPFRRRIATILQAQLRDVGVDLEVRSHDWGTFYGDVKAGRFELFALSWVGLQMPDIFRHAFHSRSMPPTGANRGRYADAATDRLIDAAEQASAPATQAAAWRAVQARLHDTLPYLPLWYEDTLVVQGPRVLGYDTDIHGQYDGLTALRLPIAASGPAAR